MAKSSNYAINIGQLSDYVIIMAGIVLTMQN